MTIGFHLSSLVEVEAGVLVAVAGILEEALVVAVLAAVVPVATGDNDNVLIKSINNNNDYEEK